LRQVISVEDFKKQAQAGGKPDGLLRKLFTVEEVKGIEETDEGLKVPFVISTGSVDRVGDDINPDGWKLGNYRRNPVVLWAHNSAMPPVARSLHEFVEDGRLKSTALFTPKDLNAFGYMVGQMYAKAFLKATSVGFMPMKWNWVEDPNRKFGIHFDEQELLEYSCCPVPANPEALLDAKAAGIDTGPMLDWATLVLDGAGAGLSREQAERIHKSLADHKFISVPAAGAERSKTGPLSLYERRLKFNENRRSS
jgi:hypothetical protein